MTELRSYRLPLLTALLSVCGIALSVISLYQHTAIKFGLQSGPSFCNINAQFNCDAVNQSAWSTMLGLPIAAWALSFYLGLFFFSILASHRNLVSQTSSARAILALATFSLVFSLYLFVISQVYIKTVCLVCVGLYLVSILLFVFAWLFEKSEPFWMRLWGGIVSILSLPRYFFGFGLDSGSVVPALVRSGFLTIILALFFSITLPEFLVINFLYKPENDKRRQEAIKQAFEEWKKEGSTELPITLSADNQQDYSIGPDSAPIRVVEFSDYECPICRAFSFAMDDFLKEYEGKIQFIFKNYPLDRSCNLSLQLEMHKSACFSAKFARCAGEQGRFWDGAAYVFSLKELDEPNSPEIVRAALLSGIQTLNLDSQGMNECLASSRQDQKIARDISEGNSLGVQGTPSIWINGKRVGAPNPELLKLIFDFILQNK